MNETTWAIVELMGHVRLAGRLTEEEKFGTKMGRLDIPLEDGLVTQYFGGGSVYRITFVTEEVARHVAKSATAAPVSTWDFPKRLAASPTVTAGDDSPKAWEPEEDQDDDYISDE